MVGEIEKLITDVLAPDLDISETPLLEIYKKMGSSISDSEMIEISEKAILEIENSSLDTVDAVARFVASVHASYLFSGSIEMILTAIDSQKDPSLKTEITEKISQFISELEDKIESDKMRLVVGSNERSIGFLEEFFGDDLKDVLSDVTGAKTPTVKRWLSTGKISNRNSRKITQLTSVFYQMRNHLDMKDEEIIAWFEKPIKGTKQSPREVWGGWSGYSYPPDIRQELADMNIQTRGYY